ncbi:hypothetical protein TVAG_424940 [Trichomonas vaginalis G3]|uniref:Uncharacterized protein n=1 Tax=Trichomonas vaginalis (strain ATCC PRA-98 / G3) TaxID=412133 RepID=A2F5E4_TRIV3|nr:hypothetical protein TVAGG3_0185480 [Trichomonas vaginalis G3]EAX99857.1 hypothetical protein TVAG_424940 [Trichomonas vaginalis G3]KAI5549608.1 hypothetical protein TVAGG3_0185480 [Trichomonas vaginalis G3]|eukprot:XP_001312787.1 hypothetical protein [Trichomonas vaginalis G3]
MCSAKRIMKSITWDFEGSNETIYECNSKGKLILSKKNPRTQKQMSSDLAKFYNPSLESFTPMNIPMHPIDFPVPLILQEQKQQEVEQQYELQSFGEIADVDLYKDDFILDNSFENTLNDEELFFETFDVI